MMPQSSTTWRAATRQSSSIPVSIQLTDKKIDQIQVAWLAGQSILKETI
jgi:hypothetical protein